MQNEKKLAYDVFLNELDYRPCKHVLELPNVTRINFYGPDTRHAVLECVEIGAQSGVRADLPRG